MVLFLVTGFAPSIVMHFMRSEYMARRFGFCARLRLYGYMCASRDVHGVCYSYDEMKAFLKAIGEEYLLQ